MVRLLRQCYCVHMNANGTGENRQDGARRLACSVADAALYLGISVSSVRALIRNDRLPARRFGSKTLIAYADLDSLFGALPEREAD